MIASNDSGVCASGTKESIGVIAQMSGLRGASLCL